MTGNLKLLAARTLAATALVACTFVQPAEAYYIRAESVAIVGIPGQSCDNGAVPQVDLNSTGEIEASFASSSATMTHGCPSAGISFTANASSEIDLAQGTMKAFASAGPAYFAGTPSAAQGLVEFRDTLIFFGTPAGELIEIGVTLRLDAFISEDSVIGSNPIVSNSLVIFDTIFGGTPFSETLNLHESGSLVATGFFTTGSNLGSVDIRGMLFSYAENGSLSDASHTSSIFFTLPPGVSMTSESGFFLTQQENQTSVPEPAGLALLGLGIVGLGFARRRILTV